MKTFDLETEKAIIGSCLTDGLEAIAEVQSAFATPADLFHDLSLREVWHRLLALVEKGRQISVAELERVKHTENIEPSFIRELFSASIAPSLLPGYLQTAVEFAQRRHLIKMGQNLVTVAADTSKPICDAVAGAEKAFFALGTKPTAAGSMKNTICAIADEWEYASQHQGEHTGIDSGIRDLDKLTWGFQRGDLCLIGARPSQGKTALLCGIANHAAIDQRVPTLFFSLESSAREIIKRILCQRARVDMTTLRNGSASNSDLQRIALEAARIAGAPIHIVDDCGLNVGQLRSIARRYHREHGIKLILGDYLQHVRPSHKQEKKTYEIGTVSTELKEMCKELDVPAVWAAQLNREVDKSPKVRLPRPSDLGDSKQIEQDADFIGLLHRLPSDNNQSSVGYNLLVSKHRNGACGYVPLRYIPTLTKFEGANHHDA